MMTIHRLLPCVLLLACAGCARWRWMPSVPPPDQGTRIASARVTPRETGRMVVLYDVRVTADSLTGWRAGDPDPSGLLSGPRRRMAIHRDDVLVFERSAPNRWAATAAVAVVAFVVAIGFAGLYVMGSGEV